MSISGAGRNHQVIVWVGATRARHLAMVLINTGHFVDKHGDIALMAPYFSQWRRDGRSRQAGVSDVLEKWLKLMVVGSIHQGDPYRGFGQLQDGGKPSKAAAENQHVRLT